MFEDNRDSYLKALGLSLVPLPAGALVLAIIWLGLPLPGLLHLVLIGGAFLAAPGYILYSTYVQAQEDLQQALAFFLLTMLAHIVLTIINAMLLYAGVMYLQQRMLASMLQQMG